MRGGVRGHGSQVTIGRTSSGDVFEPPFAVAIEMKIEEGTLRRENHGLVCKSRPRFSVLDEKFYLHSSGIGKSVKD